MMASFSAFGGDLPFIGLIVLHSLEGSVLWSSVSMFFSDVRFENTGKVHPPQTHQVTPDTPLLCI